MNTVRHALLLLSGIALLVGCATTAPSVPEASTSAPAALKHPLDKSEYRRFVLDNDLKAAGLQPAFQ